MSRRLFTSESVTEGHPDKIADQISDSILDAMLTEDPRSRVAVETMITTGQVHVAGEVTTAAYADIAGIVRERILEIGYDSSAKGFDGALLRRLGVDRRAVAGHRPGRRRRLRGAHRRGRRRPARPPGRRRPGPDVRLRLRRHPRAHAAADRRWRTGWPSGCPRCARTAPCPTCARTARPRSPSSTTATARSASTPSSSPASTPPTSTSRRCSQPDIAEHVVEPVLAGARHRHHRLPAAGQPDRPVRDRRPDGRRRPHRPQDHRRHLRRHGPPRRRRVLRQGPVQGRPVRAPTRCAGSPRTSSPPGWPAAARCRSPTRSARRTRSACSSRPSAPRRCRPSAIQDAVVRGLRPAAGRDHPRPRPAAADLRPDRGVRPLRPRAAGLHLGAHRPRRRPPGRRLRLTLAVLGTLPR